jgi:hypothetical protein
MLLTLLCRTMQVVTVIVIILFAWISPVYPQARQAFTINEISELLKSGISPTRVAGFVEQYGVAFELDDRTLQRLKQDGASEAVLAAVKRMSAQYTEQRQLKIKEQEEANKRQQQEEAKRKEQERRRVEEQKRQQAEAERVKQAEEQRRKQETRLAEEKRRVEEEARGAAPACLVGQKLRFGFDNGRSFTREITAHEDNLCLVKNVNTYYLDKDWKLVKVVGSKGQTFESPTPGHTDIGEKWLPFPLTVGKKMGEAVSGILEHRPHDVVSRSLYRARV